MRGGGGAKDCKGWLRCRAQAGGALNRGYAEDLLDAGDVRTFEGHAFMVEAAVSLGGKDVKVWGRGGAETAVPPLIRDRSSTYTASVIASQFTSPCKA